MGIGLVTAGSWSPYLECGIGYVRLDGADGFEPRRASVIGFDLAEHACEIIDLPFYDAEKKIPRGFEASIVPRGGMLG